MKLMTTGRAVAPALFSTLALLGATSAPSAQAPIDPRPSAVAVHLAVRVGAELSGTILHLIELMNSVWDRDLLVNGSLEGPYSSCGNDDECPAGWSLDQSHSGEGLRAIHVEDNGPSRPGGIAWEFDGTGGSGSIQLVQAMNLRADRYAKLELSLDVKVYSHDLEAGGWATPAFEWPVRLEIRFLDESDTSQIFRHGWYVNPPGDGARVNDPGSGSIPIYHDVQVTPGTWSTHVFDLKAELPDVERITSVRIGGAGWNFRGRADNLELRGLRRGGPRS